MGNSLPSLFRGRRRSPWVFWVANVLMSSWFMVATAFVSLDGGGGMMWASFVGVWDLSGSIGLS